MSVFDLKQADIRLRDGFSAAGAVNNGAGYSIGATTMVVDGFTGIIPVNAYFGIASGQKIYKVTSTIETSGNTTTLNFSPGLKVAVVDNAVLNVGGRQITARIGEGNLTFDENRAVEYFTNRGKIDEVRLGNETPIDVSLDFTLEFYTGDATDPGGGLPSFGDILKKKGLAASFLSTDPDPCRPYCIDILIDYIPTCTSVKRELIELLFYRWEKLSYDPKAGTVKTTGKCNDLEATSTRFTQ